MTIGSDGVWSSLREDSIVYDTFSIEDDGNHQDHRDEIYDTGDDLVLTPRLRNCATLSQIFLAENLRTHPTIEPSNPTKLPSTKQQTTNNHHAS